MGIIKLILIAVLLFFVVRKAVDRQTFRNMSSLLLILLGVILIIILSALVYLQQ